MTALHATDGNRAQAMLPGPGHGLQVGGIKGRSVTLPGLQQLPGGEGRVHNLLL